MFGLSVKALAIGAAIASLGVGYGAIQKVSATKADQRADRAEIRLQAARADLHTCAARLTNIQEAQADEDYFNSIPDDALGDGIPGHWLRVPATGAPGSD